MPELFDLTPPKDALEKLLSAVREALRKGAGTAGADHELIPVEEALGRVTAGEVRSPHPLPAFIRSTMDGYAVRAADTYGASESLPAYLTVTGEVLMGTAPDLNIGNGECAVVHTGGMLPRGADAVVMIERTQRSREGEIEVLRPVAVGENVIQVGEDIESRAVIFGPGHRLRPQDIGGLTALGITEIDAARKPQVAIISTGDEVIPPEEELGPGKVRDINSYTLSALVEQAGGAPDRRGIVPDRYEAVLQEVETALESADILVITAGSSVSVRDLTVKVIEALGEPGVLVHGVSLKPGKPTILAVCGGKPVIGLPGNPVSALVAARLFLLPAVAMLLGVEQSGFHTSATVKAGLTRNISSLPGREDYIPVRLLSGQTPEAEPVFGKSNLIYTLIHADGLITVPLDANGLHSGDEVEVVLFS